MNLLKRLIREEEGQAVTEYALIIGLILLVVIVAITGLGEEIKKIFQKLIDSVKEPASTT